MKEQTTQETYSKEALSYLKKEVPNLTDTEYNDLTLMLGNQPDREITLKQAEGLVYTAKNMDEAEAMMFQQPIMK